MQCQTLLPAGRVTDTCPVCLIEQFRQPPPGPPPASYDRQTEASASAANDSSPELAELTAAFPQWEIIENIGRGGMGSVYRVRQRSLNRIVALKVLPQELVTEPGFAERFGREAQVLAQLNHPNVVTVHEAGHSGALYYLLMEFVNGTDLRTAIRTRSPGAEQALQVVQQICVALQYAHQMGVVHRDIKPENILLDRHGRVKIADFGLAKMVYHDAERPSLTRTNQVMGTPHYMAPEQIEKPLTVDHRADIYSLGVVFYELLTGHLPMGRFRLPSSEPGVDQRLDDVVMRSLEREPDERFQNAGEVGSEVDRISRTWNSDPQLVAQAATAADRYPRTPGFSSPSKPAKPHHSINDDSPRVPLRPSWNPGMMILGLIMVVLGFALMISSRFEAAGVLWVDLGLALGGFGTIAGAFKKDSRPQSWIPNPGSILGGCGFLLLGVWMLVSEQLEPELFAWVGIGLSIAGGGLCVAPGVTTILFDRSSVPDRSDS